ncbi:MAG: aminotransferase class I/II-fold pyridoxal phosphate-dependent enzyme [Paracoccaceae bacterium]|nr:MAG: aminotransferase class I/II-fold pyridoxal phosphate-dependent enzyme [Paracoccaceae bacterium]
MAPRPVAQLATVAAYPLADLAAGMTSLAQNESCCPPSPSALAAARAALADAALYPDPDCTDLRAAIADVHGLPPRRILCGAGSMDLIAAVARAYLAPGDRALMPAHGYLYFATAARLAGAVVDMAPEAGLTVDVAALLDRVTPQTRVVFVANPGNPTGTRIGQGHIVALRDGLPGDVLLVVDEAYAEFAPPAPVFDLVARGNTIVLRSFSKAYGLAGLRAGWGLFPDAIRAEVQKCMPPNGLTAPTQAAAAAAMRDQAWMGATVAATAARRDAFCARLRGAGLDVPQSHTNFALIGFGSPAAAARADAALRAGGILLRGMAGYGLPDRLRATIGTEDDMHRAAVLIEGSLA